MSQYPPSYPPGQPGQFPQYPGPGGQPYGQPYPQQPYGQPGGPPGYGSFPPPHYGPLPASRYHKALKVILWVEAVWFLLSIVGTLVMPLVFGTAARHERSPTQMIISIVVSLGLAALAAGGAMSIGRGGFWKGSVITLTVIYGLVILGLFAIAAQIRPSKAIPLPPMAGVAILAATIGLLIGGMYWCWAKGSAAWRENRMEAGPPPAAVGLGVSLPSKILLVAVPWLMLMGARADFHTVACMSNLRQVGMAVQMYANENKGYLPATFKAAPKSVLQAYLGVDKVESCPDDSDGGPHRYVYILDHMRETMPSAAAGLGSSTPRPVKMYSLRNPSTAPLFWDNAARHDGKRAVSFMDGHTELITEAEFQQALNAAMQDIGQRMGGR